MSTLVLAAIIVAKVNVTTADNVRLAATYYTPKQAAAGAPAAILLPMFQRSRADWDAFARAAAERGVACLAIDPRGHGESPNPTGRPVARWGGAEWGNVLRDVAGARQFLVGKRFTPARIRVVGASIGGSLALEYASRDRELGGAALLSAGTDLTGRGPRADVARYGGDRRLFVAWSDDDRAVAPRCAGLAAASQKSTQRRYRRAGHGTDMLGRENPRGDLTQALIAWLLEGTDAKGDKASSSKAAEPASSGVKPKAKDSGLKLRAGETVERRFAQRSPRSAVAEMTRRFGWTAAQLQRAGHRDYDLAEEPFLIRLPSRQPKGGYGLIVWLSPGEGRIDPAWTKALDTNGLIAVAPRNAGNERLVPIRLGLSLDAVHALSDSQPIDAQRVYIAGFSGGGRVASMAGLAFPDVFKGALACGGFSYYRQVPVPEAGGTAPADFRAPTAALQRQSQSSRFVMVSGERERNTVVIKAKHAALRTAGFQHATLQVTPDAGHEPPTAAVFARALKPLDPAGEAKQAGGRAYDRPQRVGR